MIQRRQALITASWGRLLQHENIVRNMRRETSHGTSYEHQRYVASHFSICPKQYLNSLVTRNIADKRR